MAARHAGSKSVYTVTPARYPRGNAPKSRQAIGAVSVTIGLVVGVVGWLSPSMAPVAEPGVAPDTAG
ncbi:hypothetical protein [Gemmata obscuriglobus]|uniref:Uncharacterized protein n=1 Tax=Gemmata obscuriglobus TaxID=114 RepID=A0A2Z3H756_9BACT|nr:hypothetical protein [Gemmata obscuriglobus]AWM39416.1 hypothetical protein C1280_22120 [Gemmata obscuriglobus]